MAPHPQAPAASAQPQPQSQSQSALPGMKRGIAIGVAASVCIILIALLAIFAVRRRKMLSAQRAQVHPPKAIEEKQCLSIPEKQGLPVPDEPMPAPLVEADTRPIYELDADPVPEFPTKDTGRKAQELDGETVQSNPYASAYWNLDAEKRRATRSTSQATARGAPLRLVPVLHLAAGDVAVGGHGATWDECESAPCQPGGDQSVGGGVFAADPKGAAGVGMRAGGLT